MESKYPVVINAEGTNPGLNIPEELDGMDGELRDYSRKNMLKVETDIEAVESWISVQFSNDTKKAYAKEVDRLLLWCYRVSGKPLSSLYRSDLDEYREFMINPPADWCGPRRKRSNPEWRPFVGPLSEKSATQALIIIKALMSYLTENGYIVTNPLAGKLKKSTDDSPYRMVFLPEEWDSILLAADEIPDGMMDDKNPRQEEIRMQYERGRWLVRLMIGTGLRINEIATHKMGAFRESQNAEGEIKWRFYVEGKGKKKRWVPVNDRLMKGLRRYRGYLGLTALPTPSDSRPLIPNVRTGNHVTPRRLSQVLKNIFKRAAKSIEERHPHRAEKLRMAHPHTIRHTYITEIGKKTDLRIQQKLAGHDDPKTTMIYNHIEDDAMHQAVDDAVI